MNLREADTAKVDLFLSAHASARSMYWQGTAVLQKGRPIIGLRVDRGVEC